MSEISDAIQANRWSSESRVKLASTMPSRDRGGQNVKEEDVSQRPDWQDQAHRQARAQGESRQEIALTLIT